MSVLVERKKIFMAYKLNQCFYWYLAALFTMTIGFLYAAHQFPGGFDWVYTVASALMSQKHNLSGSFWFSASMSLTMLLLWLYLTQRELGWVDASWREKGIPIWLSFAFWQWWMIASLWVGLGMLNYVMIKRLK